MCHCDHRNEIENGIYHRDQNQWSDHNSHGRTESETHRHDRRSDAVQGLYSGQQE
jgi:hypothetical protein